MSFSNAVAFARKIDYVPWVYGAALLLTLIPASIAVLFSDAGWTPLVKVLAVAIAVGAAAALFQSAARKTFSFAMSLFWMWVYVFLGLTQLYQLASNKFPWGAAFDDSTVLTAQAVILLGSGSLYLASEMTMRRKRAVLSATAAHGEPPVRPAKLRITVLTFCYAYSAVTIWFIISNGSALFQGKAAFQDQLEANASIPGSGTVFLVAIAGAMCIPAIAIIARRYDVGIPLPVVLLVCALGFVATNPLTGSRFLTGTFLLALIGALLLRRHLLRFVPLGIMLTFVTLFPSLDILRNDGTGAEELALSMPSQTLLTFDFDSFEMLLRAVTVFGHVPNGFPTPFELFLAPVLRWVPVLSATTQGHDGGPVVAEITGMTWTNVSMPLWGEAYLVGGFVAVALAFAAFGIVLGLVRPSPGVLQPMRTPAALMIEVPVGALLIMLLRGSLASVLGYLLFTLALGIVIWLVWRRDEAGPRIRTRNSAAGVSAHNRPQQTSRSGC
ncbi:hypothetical protein [Microterricola gilva]|nr:hypothetical protein [Microterricola gilva]